MYSARVVMSWGGGLDGWQPSHDEVLRVERRSRPFGFSSSATVKTCRSKRSNIYETCAVNTHMWRSINQEAKYPSLPTQLLSSRKRCPGLDFVGVCFVLFYFFVNSFSTRMENEADPRPVYGLRGTLTYLYGHSCVYAGQYSCELS